MRLNKITVKKVCYASLLVAASNAVVAEDVETSFYGSLRLGMDYVDAGTVDDAANGRDFLSRIGAKASVSLTDSLTGIGQIEYGLRGEDSVNFEQNQNPGLRQAYVGV